MDMDLRPGRVADDVERRADGRHARAHVGQALVSEDARRRRVEAVAIVLDHQVEPAGFRAVHEDGRAARARVPRDVAQGLVDHAEEVRGRRRVGLLPDVADMQLDVDHRVVPELLDDRDQAVDEGRSAQQLRSEAEDEVPDVPDRQVQAVDRPLDPPLDLLGIVPDQLGHVLERQPDRVDVLDDPVVEVLADALAFVDDREPLDLLVEPRVLDRDAGMDGEGLDQRLILLGELVGAGLVREVQVPDRATLHRDGNAQEAVHRRVVRREPVAPRIDRDVRDPERAVLAHDQPEEPVTARNVADPRPGLAIHAGGDEAFHDAVGVDDAERRILGADQRSDLVDDHLQDVVDRLQLGDRAGRGLECADHPARRGIVPGARSPESR